MAEEEFESIRVIREEVGKGRNDGALVELQRRKLEVRNQLVAARAEMRKIDAELIGNGANGLDLVMVCW
jgi:hypothetical protein